MTEVIGTAEIRVDADATPFERAADDVRDAARSASRQAVRDLNRIGDSLSQVSVDSDRAADSIARDLRIAIADAENRIADVDIEATVDAGAQSQITRQLRQVVRSAQAATRAIQANVELDPDTRTELADELRDVVDSAQDRARAIQLEVDLSRLSDDVADAVDVAERDAGPVDIDVQADEGSLGRFRDALSSVGQAARSAAPTIGLVTVAVGALGAALGSTVALAATLSGALAEMAPAAGLAAPAILSAATAAGALQLGMAGVGDAAEAAFDNSAKGAETFTEALQNLSPNAVEFVTRLREMAPELRAFQQSIQERLFTGFADTLESLSGALLPTLRSSLGDVAESFNLMATSAARSAGNLADSGVLGQALESATAGIRNLAGVPALAVTAFGQLAAAAGPAFDRLTAAAADGAAELGERIGDAFESGGLQRAIEAGIDAVGQLFSIIGNLGDAFGSIFSAARAESGSFLDVLENITGAMAEAFASEEVQVGLRAFFSAISTLSTTAGPLLVQVLGVVAGAFAAISPALEVVTTALGDALGPVLDALGPVLDSVARAFGELLIAISPLLPVAGQLAAAILPALVPLFDALGLVFVELAPVVAEVATLLADTLGPILAILPGLVAQLLPPFTQIAVQLFPLVAQLLREMSPSLVELATAIADVAVELAPLVALFAQQFVVVLQQVAQFLPPVISFVARLASTFADDLAAVLRNVVMPAVRLVASLLTGDLSGALRNARELVVGVVRTIRDRFGRLPAEVLRALRSLAANVGSRFREAGQRMSEITRERIGQVIDLIRSLPRRAASALGNLGGVLYGAGRSLVQGFINGIRSLAGSVADAARGIAQTARNFFPFSPAKEGPFSGSGYTLNSGRKLVEDFGRGIESGTGDLTSSVSRTLSPVAAAVPGRAATATGTLGDGGAALQVTFINQGVLGSREEVESWLVETLDRLRLQRRLPVGVTV